MRIRNLENQLSQLASAMSRVESQFLEELHSQTIDSSEQNMSAITLKRDEGLQEFQNVGFKHTVEEEAEKEGMRSQSQTSSTKKSNEQPSTVVIHPSFPDQFTRSNEEEEEEREILKMFHKFEKPNCSEKICMEKNASAVQQ